MGNIKYSKLDRNNEPLFLLTFFIFIYVGVLKTSLLVPAHISMSVIFFVFKLSGGCAFLTFLFRKNINILYKILMTLAAAVSYLLCIPAQNFDFFYYLIFVIAAFAISFRSILKTYIISAFLGIFTVLFSCLLGIIPNETFARQGLSIVRNSFGFFTPTDFAARFFFLLLAYYMLKKFHLSWKENMAIFIMIGVIYYLTNARLDTCLLLLLLLCGLLAPYLERIITALGTIGSFVISVLYIGGSVLLSVFYDESNKFLAAVNNLLSGRIKIGQQAFQEKGVTFFGQYFHEQGNGLLPKGDFQYFYIDSSYIRLLVISGLLFSLIMLVAVYYLQKRFITENLFYYSVGFFIVIFSSAVDQHFMDSSYNFMFLALFAELGFATRNFSDIKNKDMRDRSLPYPY